MAEPFAQKLRRYADVAVQVGANLQPGQHLIVRSDLGAAPLVREIARSAYQNGAPYVHVFWADEQITLNRYRYAARDSFGEYPSWQVRSIVELIDAGAAMISIASEDPSLMSGEDQELIAQAQKTAAVNSQPMRARITRSALNWSIVASPSKGWAAKVFADTPEAEQQEQMWEAIFSICRIDQANPVDAWRKHIDHLAARSAYLNAKRYSALHYTGPGTDLTIGLADNHIWISGAMESERGVRFVANLPTEEVFTMPHRMRVDGTVRATKPLDVGGSLIEDFSVTFREGRVVEVSARKGEELLRRLVQMDEGAAHIGEVALVPEHSPIAQSKRIFYNTLFDENAASHIALGMAYRFTMEGGTTMDNEAYTAAGGNDSSIHVDFMIGSGEVDIDGVTADGAREPVMRQGEWAFEV
ncbi:aminopeptidase [Chloroflexia bacterium SDU3-3]|nr:aminopeptidase [Chloroflexia bacterium SDU3-3]